MNNILDLQRKIVPEALVLLEKRYTILKEIYLSGSIGRRTLANKLDISERLVRSEIEFLKSEGLILVDSIGMQITQAGIDVLDQMSEYIAQIRGLSVLQEQIAQKLEIKKVFVVPTSIDDNQDALKELGKEAAKYFVKTVSPDSVVGITGGYTMNAFSEHMTPKDFPNITLVPARGGLGETLEIQSNSIVARLANKLSAGYKLLHIQDTIDKGVMNYIYNDPQIKAAVDQINKIDYLIFGIGSAENMALRRKSSQTVLDEIKHAGAVAEAFGHYFDINGQIVYETSSVGIKLEQYKNLENVIGIAGGSNKAEAIMAISKINKNLILITDESAAYKILGLLD